jgi:peptidoglycan hydrolase-like protein with peptidoglycan-binding domain
MALGFATPVQAQSYPPTLLQPNAQGESVTQLQQELSRLGYYQSAVTGNFDAATQEAVMQFQQANGLAADGIVGAETQAALSNRAAAEPSVASPEATSPASGTAASTMASSQVSTLQQQLAELGYYKGAVNGSFDNATTEAVMSFQRDRGLAVDGIVGSATEAALSQTPASQTPTTETASTATTEATASTDLLQLGDTGSAVSDLQSRLQTLGYYNGPISGSFGSQTQVALTAFQQAQGLTADGIAGPQVNAALASASIPSVQPATPSGFSPAANPTTPAVLPAALPQTPQTAVAPVIPTTLPSASVQVPALPPAIPEATAMPSSFPSSLPGQLPQSGPSTPPSEDGRFSVIELQRRLQLNGFNPAEMTGQYDSATQSAINQAQQSYGLSSQDLGI